MSESYTERILPDCFEGLGQAQEQVHKHQHLQADWPRIQKENFPPEVEEEETSTV